MAVFPEGNPGQFPVDPESDVGKFRALVGDLSSTPYDPVEPGFQDFEKFSDTEIEGYLAQGEGSIPRAIGYSYLYLAGQAALTATSVRDYDLQVDNTKRADGLIAIANMWFGKADEEGADYFDIVPVGSRGRRCKPEAAPWPVGRR